MCLLPGLKFNRISKEDVFDSKKFFVIFMVIYALQHWLLSYLMSDIYVNRRGKLLVSVILSSYFFPVKCHYLVFRGHVFRLFEVFTKSNIVMPGRTICLYIDKKETTLFTCEPNFTAHWPFLAEKRRIKT